MASRCVLLCVAVLALCLSVAVAKSHGGGGPRRGPPRRDGTREGHPPRDHHRPSMRHMVCDLYNVTASASVFSKDCGCGNDTGAVGCNLGPLNIAGKCGEQLQAKFCDISPNWTSPRPWKGVLGLACLIQEINGGEKFKEETCRGENTTCDLGPISVTVNGTSANAFFCKRNGDEERSQEECAEPREREDSEENCVEISCARRSRDGDSHDEERPRRDHEDEDHDGDEADSDRRRGNTRGTQRQGGQRRRG